jgi:hypothetical protein
VSSRTIPDDRRGTARSVSSDDTRPVRASTRAISIRFSPPFSAPTIRSSEPGYRASQCRRKPASARSRATSRGRDGSPPSSVTSADSRPTAITQNRPTTAGMPQAPRLSPAARTSMVWTFVIAGAAVSIPATR